MNRGFERFFEDFNGGTLPVKGFGGVLREGFMSSRFKFAKVNLNISKKNSTPLLTNVKL